MLRHTIDYSMYWMDEEDKAIIEELEEKGFARFGDTLTWIYRGPKEGTIERPGMLHQAKSFLKAVTSGFAPRELVNHRLAICDACPMLKKTPQGKFCGGCGCPGWALAQLDGTVLPKLGWKGAKCPMGKW